MKCVDACPVRDTLYLQQVVTGKRVKKKYVTPLVLGSFFFFITLGIITGNWQNKITKEEYEVYIEMKNSLGHPTGLESDEHRELIEQRNKDAKDAVGK